MEEQTEPVIDQAAINAYRQRQAELCAEAIAAVLQKHKCELRATPHITPDGRIVAVPELTFVG